MGLTIHYAGTFRPDKSLSQMIEDVVAYAIALKWKFHIFETAFPQTPQNEKKIYGIIVTPPECESVHLWFNENRRLGFCTGKGTLSDTGSEAADCNLEYLISNSKDAAYSAFTKTQSAGADVHIKVVKLLKMISAAYLQDFFVSDESYYWETGNEEKLRRLFDDNLFYSGSQR